MRTRLFTAAFSLATTLAALGVSPAYAQYKGSIDPPEDLKQGYDAITDENARAWLSILAGPGFEGRGTGQLGYTKAAHWVAGKVAEFGLDPMGDGGTYFQMLPMTRLSVEPAASKLTGPNNLEIIFDKAIGLERFTNQPEVAGGVAFVSLSGPRPNWRTAKPFATRSSSMSPMKRPQVEQPSYWRANVLQRHSESLMNHQSQDRN